MWHGKLIRESTHQGNDKVARQMESAHRTSLAKGEVGIREKKPSPTLSQFIDLRFEPWAKATFEKTSPKTWFDYYRVGLRNIKATRLWQMPNWTKSPARRYGVRCNRHAESYR